MILRSDIFEHVFLHLQTCSLMKDRRTVLSFRYNLMTYTQVKLHKDWMFVAFLRRFQRVLVTSRRSIHITRVNCESKGPSGSMYEINHRGETTSRPRTNPAIHGLQIRCSSYWPIRCKINCSKRKTIWYY